MIFAGDDWLDFAVTFCAVQKSGGIPVLISARTPPPEAAALLADCGASGVVHGPDVTPPPRVPMDAMRMDTMPMDAVRMDAMTPSDLEPDAGTGPLPLPRAGDIAQILYTSGTTGRPKAVSATHANLTHGHVTGPRRRAFAHSRRLLHAFPLATNAAQMMILHALTAAPSVMTLPQFTPERFARLIAEHAVGTVFLVPAMAMELLNARVHDRHDLSSVLLLGSAAAALPPAVAADLAAAFPNATITNYYTSTEAAPAQTVMIYDPARPAALGRPAAGSDLKIAGPDGAPLPPGRTGEVWLRAPGPPRAYFRAGELAADAHEAANAHDAHEADGVHVGDDVHDAGDGTFRDGWVRMGDLGFLDDEGYLHLVDRQSDVVKSGAFKVSTLQVEAALHEHSQIIEAAAFGVPHPVMGTTVAAAVVARAPVSLAGMRSFLRDRLAEHELPTRLLVVDSLPRNTAGKIIKSELRELASSRAAERPRSG